MKHQFKSWSNLLGVWIASPRTGAHYGPYRDPREAELAMIDRLAVESPPCQHLSPLTKKPSKLTQSRTV